MIEITFRMEKEEFEKLSKQYSSLVKDLIEDNFLYTNINERIKWTFGWDDNPAITATVSRGTNIISVNVVFVDRAYRENRVFDIEYFLLHEMRHIYQHIQIQKYKSKEHTIGEAFILKWIEEGKNYIKSLDENGNENPDYYKQDCELDAYAFSYAVMSYKYSRKYNPLLFVPEIYKHELKEEFDSAVSEFLGVLTVE